MNNKTSTSNQLQNFLSDSALYFLLWLLLTNGWLNTQEIIVGAVIAIVGAFISYMVSKNSSNLVIGNLTPVRVAYLAFYVVFLLWQIVLATWDVTKRVVSPTLPINPGIVKVKTNLKSPLGRLILANSITLTPGTLTVDVQEDVFCIHWIDVQSEDIEAATNEIIGSFEKYLEVIFG